MKNFLNWSMFFLSAIIGIALIIEISQDTKDPSTASIVTEEPQEYMKQLAMVTFSDQGRIKNVINAKYWAYLPQTQISTLVTPVLSFNKPGDNTIWLISAHKGSAVHPSLDSKIERLELQDNVIVEQYVGQQSTNSAATIKVETEQAYFYPETEEVKTDHFVTMTKPGLLITGTGLEGHFKKHIVKLLHNVKTSYKTI